MKKNGEKPNGDDVLHGWFQIERYLGITRKTVLARGFPVRKNGGVWAITGDLKKHIEGFRMVSADSGGRTGPKTVPVDAPEGTMSGFS